MNYNKRPSQIDFIPILDGGGGGGRFLPAAFQKWAILLAISIPQGKGSVFWLKIRVPKSPSKNRVMFTPVKSWEKSAIGQDLELNIEK